MKSRRPPDSLSHHVCRVLQLHVIYEVSPSTFVQTESY